MDSPELQAVRTRVDLLKSTQESFRKQSEALRARVQRVQSDNRNLNDQIGAQNTKTNALMVLCGEQQRKSSAHQAPTKRLNWSAQLIAMEGEVLKELLVRQREEAGQYEGLNQFLEDYLLSRDKACLGSFVDLQSQVSAQVQGKLAQLKNAGWTCRRKWHTLIEYNSELKDRGRTLEAQLNRQHQTMRSVHEEYLAKINKYSAKLVMLRSCAEERIISDHLIQEMALAQKQRKAAEDALQALRVVHKRVSRESDESKLHSQTVRELFSGKTEETKIACKMKQRIEELRDVVRDYKASANNPKIVALAKTRDFVQDEYQVLKRRVQILNDKYGGSLQGTVSAGEMEVAEFFNRLLEGQDQKCHQRAKQNWELTSRVEDLINCKATLELRLKAMGQLVDGSGNPRKTLPGKASLREYTFSHQQ